MIKNYDLYSEKEPSKIFKVELSEIYRGAEASIHYTFTILKKKKTKKGARFDQTTGIETWKGVDASKPIYDGDQRLIGFKKNYVYLTKSKTKRRWNILEYNLDSIALKHAMKLGMNYDLYSEKEPSKIFKVELSEIYRGAEASIHYTFTILKKKKTKKGARFDQTTGIETWKGVDASKPIYDGDQRLIGFKKNYVYLTKSKTKRRWNILEYNLDSIALKHAMKLGMYRESTGDRTHHDNPTWLYVFFPSDRDLIHYLLQKSTERPLPCDDVIKEYDLYGEKEPSKKFDGELLEIYHAAEASIHYTFTMLKKKTKKGARFDRTIGTATRKGVDASKPIYGGDQRLIGFKKNYVYLTKSKTKGGWNILEYNLEGIALKHVLKLGLGTDYVIFHVTENIKNNQTRKEGGQAILPVPQEMQEGPPISQENNHIIIGSTSGTYQSKKHAYIGAESTMAQLPSSATPTLCNAPQLGGV
ncbi:unnamed protein product [Camellia sinensis]